MSRAEPLVFGVDFTSAPSRRKPITVAVGRLVERRGDARYFVEAIRALESLDAFAAFLRTEGPWIGGFDLPFSQPRPLIEHEGWPTDWPAFVAFYCRQPRERLRARFRRWCAGRPAGDKFAWRATDKPAGSSPAMRWANPPVAWMMHAGIGRMLAAGLSFPAHDHPRRLRGRSRLGCTARIAFEAYPGFTARHVTRLSYKSDTVAKQTVDRRARRREILRAIEQGSAGLAVVAEIPAGCRRRIVADGSGDLLDAVICGLQAGHALSAPRLGLPADLDPLEGWIAAVPGPPGRSVIRSPGDKRARP
jgi:hypothetical protein